MAISEHLREFAGKKVVDWEPGKPLGDPQTTVPVLRFSYEEKQRQPKNTPEPEKSSWMGKFASLFRKPEAPTVTEPEKDGAVTYMEGLLEDPNVAEITGLVIGLWDPDYSEGNSGPIVEALAGAKERFSSLKAIFLGDITYEECEISWIRQSDVTPILEAYPGLEELGVRGGGDLKLRPITHQNLKKLVIQAGGLGRDVVKAVAESNFPNLEHLEIWLGTDEYGADTSFDDLLPFFQKDRFPKLRYLGLKNSILTDQIAMAIVTEPVMEQLKVLDLSMGTLADDGARVLLAAPSVLKLERLVLNHHYCSPQIVEELKKLPIEVEIDEPEEADEWDGEEHRYVEIGE